MSDDKKDAKISLETDDRTADERKKLAQNILEEMEMMTPEEIERLYAAIALMEKKKDD